jgi:hypothetical protein
LKTIVVSGACSGVGKSTLARKISALIPGAVTVKIGHHPFDPKKEVQLFQGGASFEKICQSIGNVSYLIVESNSILQEITPECVIYLPADKPKPSASIARAKADIIRGETISCITLANISSRLSLDINIVSEIALVSGAVLEKVMKKSSV